MRDRFYAAETGRFHRRDVYEGRLAEPLTLHKYLYTHANPVNLVDPSGLSAIDDGNWVHEEITEDFLNTGTFRRADITVREVWEYEGIDPATIPTSIVWTNRRNARPDLIDFQSEWWLGNFGEVYEIGTVKQFPSKIAKMAGQYLPDINNGLRYSGQEPKYTYGENYKVLPPIRRNFLTRQTALIFPR